jgi:twitching motility two-component system response regulator PilG
MSGYVLVVDDDEMLRSALVETLREGDEGREVVGAADGDEALEIMRERELPALLILDLRMPRVSGWEVLERMDASPLMTRVPVIVLTASRSHDDMPRGRHVMRKPVDPTLLLDLAQTLLQQDEKLTFSLNEAPSDLMPRRLPRL